MSKSLRVFRWLFAVTVMGIACCNAYHAQDIQATITVREDGRAHVRGSFGGQLPAEANRMSFLLSYAGIDNLGERVSEMRALDDKGATVGLKRISAGEYTAGGMFREWSYVVDLAPLKARNAAAQLSWVSGGSGVLVLDDLLPQTKGKRANVRLELPDGWRAFTTERPAGVNEYSVDDIEKVVFVIGPRWRERSVKVGETTARLVLSGEWHFGDDEAVNVAAEVLGHYAKLFGSAPKREFQIAVTRFPSNVPAGSWEGATRGASVTIASSDVPFKSQSLQRLHEQLRHEIFHLWVPNGLNLKGNYDWFYEGFALYQSLKMGVAVNRISFDDMLDTLSRAYDVDKRGSSVSAGRSLIDLSMARWNGENTTVYARGMLLAFLCDLALLSESKGKRSTSGLVRDIYVRHGMDSPVEDANAAIIASLTAYPQLRPIVDAYITGTKAIDRPDLLAATGLEAEISGETKLKVKRDLSGRQKQLLNKLGYNNWRKVSSRQ